MKTGLDSIPNKQVELNWNNIMHQYYALIKQPAEALAYSEKYIRLRYCAKSVRMKGEPEIFDQMNLLQSKYEVSLLKKDNEITMNYLWAAAVLIFLMVVIAVLAFFLLRKSRKNISVLTVLNNKINQKQILLEDTLAQLKKENQEKQHILHIVAHDLRNPIAAIHALATLTEDDYENEDSTRENLALIKNTCMEGNELISSILEIAENEEVKYDCGPVDVNVWLSDNMQFLRLKARDKNQHIGLMTLQKKELFMLMLTN